MAHQPATNSQFMRLGLWTFASIAAIASAAALFFALRSHHEHLRGTGFATQLSMKEQELAKKQSELERSKSALARLARAAKAPTVAPAPSSSPDSQALLKSEGLKELSRLDSLARRQDSLAPLHSIYDPMLTHFNLSPEQRKRFYELHGSPGSEEELRKMFGERGFQSYQSYAASEFERTVLLQFQEQTDTKSLQFADWQYDRLVDAIVQARKQHPQNTVGVADSYEDALGQATQFLTPDQLESARSFFHNQAELLREVAKLIPPGIEPEPDK